MNARSTSNISDLRCYDKVVDDVTYQVPRGITRDLRGRVWIVRVSKNKQLIVNARFTDKRFDGTRRALEAAIIHLVHSGYAWLGNDVLQLSERAAVHWRKRSGIGLCAVAYVASTGRGRGKTFFLSTYKRVASGRGMDKFRGKLQDVLEHAYKIESGGMSVPPSIKHDIARKLECLWPEPGFKAFLEAGARKADQIAVAQYLETIGKD
ncbi:MAG TPA: hypothetical protein VF671_24500 [Pseudomonas sp.]|jgi:hypothetical protein|uniref:hypothetical protein n=1 Tax=Pseudomonas sp. TaxID=306 RepID=UPI002EDA3826